MAEIAITVDNLVLRYRRLNNYSIKRQLLSFRQNRKDGKGKTGTFEALKGVSFELEKGEILGIIGKNGSGKSTMLRALAGIFSPDEGSIDLHGHGVSLLAIGVGFKGDLTGRENIFLSGMLLGFTKEYIEEKLDEIIEFAELGDFIEYPVRTYSSGMHSKLAFSITAILEADIMLIDEVLSVGDERFRKKSYEKMKSLISNKDRTVVIVSHSIPTLQELCTKVMWLHEGEVKEIGDPKEVLEHYREFMK
ncbi:MAG: ABC transporter ATP-binding protein [Lachnospiraceae bacterium]|nr:ABC transporter ATP-binding protein [Lachnospiraceae bacterium]